MNDMPTLATRIASALALAFYGVVALCSLYVISKLPEPKPRLACSVAEISPDFTNQDREKCRQARGHKL